MGYDQKIVKKSSHWAKHGKHRGILPIVCARNRERAMRAAIRDSKRLDDMFESVPEMMAFYIKHEKRASA
jgi:hypothetical protein